MSENGLQNYTCKLHLREVLWRIYFYFAEAQSLAERYTDNLCVFPKLDFKHVAAACSGARQVATAC